MLYMENLKIKWNIEYKKENLINENRDFGNRFLCTRKNFDK